MAWVSLLLSLSLTAKPADTNRFGFTGPELFPIDPDISNLHVADLDGDGLNDLVVVNNGRSRINLLYNRTGKNAAKQNASTRRELNDLPPDARFRIDSIPSETRIASLVVEDLNGDGRPDIAYYGEPKELIVIYNQGTNGWSAPKRWHIEDGQLLANALCAGDVNGDGRRDLVLLGDDVIYLLPQKADHTLGEPEKLPFSGAVRSVQVVDIDGDGRSDLLMVNWEDRNPFRFRLQKSDGQLGAEIYFTSEPIRSYWADNFEGNKKTQIVTIAQNSGRAEISEFTQKPAEPLSGTFQQGQLKVLPLRKTEKARRGILWADVDGDGREDLLVAEPESGQLSVFFQQEDGSLAARQSFPCLAGVSDVAVADWEGDGRPEVFVLSSDERQVGVTRLDEHKHLPFPTLLPLDGKPLVLAVGKLKPGEKPTLAVIVDNDGRRSLYTRTADGKTKVQKLSENFKANPSTLAFHDVDQDGLMDLVVLVPYEKIKVLRQVPGKDFEELDIAPPGGAVEQAGLSTADLDGDGKPELLLTQKNFARGVVLKRDVSQADAANSAGWGFVVKEQINGSSSNSRLVGAAALKNGTNAAASIFLLDAELKSLTLCERDSSGLYQVVRNIPLPISDFFSVQPAAIHAKTPNAVTLLGLNAVALLQLEGKVWSMNELDSYETPIKDGHLNDVTSGDLDQDGRKELVFLETAHNYIDLVGFNAAHKLIPGDRWQVFEERSFRGRRSDLPEPREAVVADVTGDHKNDLILLVHDRVILYPQE